MSFLTIGASTKAWANFTENLTTPSVTSQASGSSFLVFYCTGGTFTQIADSKSNVYSPLGSTITFGFGADTMAAAFCPNGIGGASHTFSLKTSSFGTGHMYVVELIGVGGSYAVLDTFATPTNGDTTPNPPTIPSPLTTVSGAGGLVIAAIMSTQDGTPTSGDGLTDTAGFNNILQNFSDGTGTTSSQPGGISGIANQSPGSYQDQFLFGSATNDHNWASMCVSFALNAANASITPTVGSVSASGNNPTVIRATSDVISPLTAWKREGRLLVPEKKIFLPTYRRAA